MLRPCILWSCLLGVLAAESRLHEPEGWFIDGWVQNYALGVGLRGLDDGDWNGLDELLAIELDYDIRPIAWPLAVAAGLHTGFASAEDRDGRDWDLEVVEIALGARRYERFGSLSLAYGLAATLSNARLTGGRYDEGHTAWGAAADLGLFWNHRDRLLVGARARYALSEEMSFSLAEDEGDLNGLTTTGVVALRF